MAGRPPRKKAKNDARQQLCSYASFCNGCTHKSVRASSSKRKTIENAWLEHVKIIENVGRNGMSVK